MNQIRKLYFAMIDEILKSGKTITFDLDMKTLKVSTRFSTKDEIRKFFQICDLEYPKDDEGNPLSLSDRKTNLADTIDLQNHLDFIYATCIDNGLIIKCYQDVVEKEKY